MLVALYIIFTIQIGVAIYQLYIVPVQGMKNGKTKENSAKAFNYIDNYGSHDWVVDNAVRYIYSDPNKQNYVKTWLYDADLNIPWNSLETTNSFWGDITDPASLFARRHVQMCYGTYLADKVAGVVSVTDSRPADNLNTGGIKYKPLNLWAATTYKGDNGPHHTFFSKNDQEGLWVYSGYSNMADSGWAPLYADEAALNAYLYLTMYDKVTKTTGKYEAAAICLGGMSHFIADMAIWGHTVRPKLFGGEGYAGHIAFESYVQSSTGLDTKYSKTEGGPSTTMVDPIQFLTDENNKANFPLEPLLPSEAVIRMAELTFTANDEKKNERSIYDVENYKNPNPDSLYAYKLATYKTIDSFTQLVRDRIKMLVINAVYYTARAILSVCQLAKTNMLGNTTIANQTQSIATEPLDAIKISNWIRTHKEGTYSLENIATDLGIDITISSSLSMAFLLMCPLMLLIILPFAAVPKAFNEKLVYA
ncbi:MAG: hypothetical protein ACFFG0_36205 [Candidatus Thorarchaeota archaeon]